MFYFYILVIFWFIRTTKSLLFWFYLWQLKYYYFNAFLAHLKTENGKRLLLNKLLYIKIFLLFLSLFLIFLPIILIYYLFIFSVLILYFLESTKALKDFFQKKLKTPTLTKKIALLILIGLIIQLLFVYFLIFLIDNIDIFLPVFIFGFLVFDILSPIIFSTLVLVFQPLTTILKNRIFKKAKQKRNQFKNLLVIGITGSYGKTSFKEFLAAILAEKFNVLKTKENHNSEIGVSQCILQELKPEHQIFICEMGSYNKGGVKSLCDIAKPKIGIVTGVNEQHLALFGSMENLLSAEGGKELIDSLPEDGMIFFNAKNKYCVDLYKKTEGIKKFLYGQEVSIVGLENIEGAKIVAKELGINELEISQATAKIKNEFPGIQIKKINNNLTIVNATYSANPTGVIAHLDYLKTIQPEDTKLIIVMPCLIELGPAGKKAHQEIGKKISETCDLAIITTKDYFKEIKQGVPNTLFIENSKEILKRIKNFIKKEKNVIILLEGRLSKQLIILIEKL